MSGSNQHELAFCDARPYLNVVLASNANLHIGDGATSALSNLNVLAWSGRMNGLFRHQQRVIYLLDRDLRLGRRSICGEWLVLGQVQGEDGHLAGAGTGALVNGHDIGELPGKAANSCDVEGGGLADVQPR